MRWRDGSTAATRVSSEDRRAVPGLVAEDVGERTPGGGLDDGDQSDEYREHRNRPDADSSPGDRATSDFAPWGIAHARPRGGT